MPIAWPSEPMATWRTMDRAAKQLKISRRTLTRWVTEGHIRSYKRPGDRHHYVDLDEIKRYQQQFTPVERKGEEEGPQ